MNKEVFNEIQRSWKYNIKRWLVSGKAKRFTPPIQTTKPGKITIPEHGGDLNPDTIKSIMKQAGL